VILSYINRMYLNRNGVVAKFVPADMKLTEDDIVAICHPDESLSTARYYDGILSDFEPGSTILIQSGFIEEGPVDVLDRLDGKIDKEDWRILNRWFGYHRLPEDWDFCSIFVHLAEMAEKYPPHREDFAILREYNGNWQQRDFGWD
jgi:hypothetical protein